MATKLVDRTCNVPDETLERHIANCIEATSRHAETGAALTRAYQAAKHDGCNVKELRAAIAARMEDPEQVKRNLRDRLRYLAAMNVPVQQLDLFRSDQPAEKVEKVEQWTAAHRRRATKEGAPGLVA